jgi:hypothetical protein
VDIHTDSPSLPTYPTQKRGNEDFSLGFNGIGSLEQAKNLSNGLRFGLFETVRVLLKNRSSSLDADFLTPKGGLWAAKSG